MPLQARAEATRRKIIDSAVDLFDESGYGETGLADVLLRARVSKGAFYYHFDSKEALAAAIIADYRHRIDEMLLTDLDPAASRLEQLIEASFRSAAIIRSDKAARIGNELLQALRQISNTAAQTYADWTDRFVTGLASAITDCELTSHLASRPDVGAIAQGAWAGVLGSHLLSGALRDDPFERLANTWRAVLSPRSPADLDRVLERFVKRHQALAAS